MTFPFILYFHGTAPIQKQIQNATPGLGRLADIARPLFGVVDFRPPFPSPDQRKEITDMARASGLKLLLSLKPSERQKHLILTATDYAAEDGFSGVIMHQPIKSDAGDSYNETLQQMLRLSGPTVAISQDAPETLESLSLVCDFLIIGGGVRSSFTPDLWTCSTARTLLRTPSHLPLHRMSFHTQLGLGELSWTQSLFMEQTFNLHHGMTPRLYPENLNADYLYSLKDHAERK